MSLSTLAIFIGGFVRQRAIQLWNDLVFGIDFFPLMLSVIHGPSRCGLAIAIHPAILPPPGVYELFSCPFLDCNQSSQAACLAFHTGLSYAMSQFVAVSTGIV
ncbi:uncharacterized protein UTRI_04618_B [Ustilago trichophora]|uniref:Uncharacterized protein n=1 Tax=Ustilago trichophora TaxID=86804 RepID=A0A5C3EET4_9BASI|nr:uncharacterized protein UTRI_04618 [Ustilago trichophora]SPO31998.1 uncharacterized protein UTRI_04618_B [Ustilago trichophora]